MYIYLHITLRKGGLINESAKSVHPGQVAPVPKYQPFLTLSQASPGFYRSAVQVF